MPKPLTSAISTALSTLVVGLALFANDACGVALERGFVQNATGACQSALLVFDGQIRKRPLAMQNEGTASAFVTCSLLSPGSAFDGVGIVEILAENNTSLPVNLTCTLVTGLSKFAQRKQFLPRTITMLPRTGMNSLHWGPIDNGGAPFTNFSINVSCNLPAGTGISKALVGYDDEVGA